MQISVEEDGEQTFLGIYKDHFKKMAPLFRPVVVSGSTSADTPTEKRNDAIAKGNIAQTFAAAGVPVDLKFFFEDIMRDGFNITQTEQLFTQPDAAPGGLPTPPQPVANEQIQSQVGAL